MAPPAPSRRWMGHAFTIAVGVIGWFVVLGLPALGVIPSDELTPALPIILFVLWFAVPLVVRRCVLRARSDR